jgi:hypothetical protein
MAATGVARVDPFSSVLNHNRAVACTPDDEVCVTMHEGGAIWP